MTFQLTSCCPAYYPQGSVGSVLSGNSWVPTVSQYSGEPEEATITEISVM